MRRQSNTPLYVVGACVVVIAIIVAVVRSNSPKDEAKESSLSGLQLGPVAEPSASALAPAPAGSDDMGRVQMLPVEIDGKPGLLVRYQADVLFEPIQQRVATNIMSKLRKEIEPAGVQYVVIMAVGPGEHDAGASVAARTHTITFKRLFDGSWVPVEDSPFPAGSASASPSSSVPVPRASASGKVPLIISH